MQAPPPIAPRPLSIITRPEVFYSDALQHGYQGPIRSVRIPRAAPSGGGTISKSEDGVRCAVAGKDSLKIMRISEPTSYDLANRPPSAGRVRHRIDASKNFWEGSGLKITSATTDVAWGRGPLNNKILTTARNGELVLWDINKAGSAKYERRTRGHVRSINKLSVSRVVHHYGVTGSSDGDLRVWDFRDISKSVMTVHFPTSVRSVVLSPTTWLPLHAMVGLDNGSIYRWDLKMAQRGQLDRLPVAHSGSVTTLDWCNATTAAGGLLSTPGNGHGWTVSGGLDRCVKVWDLTTPGGNTHIPHEPTYTLHPAFPVRKVLWRPSYQCEIAIVSSAEFVAGSNPDLTPNTGAATPRIGNSSHGLSATPLNLVHPKQPANTKNSRGDAVEIWDVRRGWIAKWNVLGSAIEGGVVDIAFRDSHAIWTQHSTGLFAQIDLREATKPLDTIPRASMAWDASGPLTFGIEKKNTWEVPYDDIDPHERQIAEEAHLKMKTLGDTRYVPTSQAIGTYTSDGAEDDFNCFSKLAQGYVLEGDSQSNICERNAQVAQDAGKEEIAQVWFLAASLLSDPPPEKTSLALSELSESLRSHTLFPHSVSAPASIPSLYSFPARPASLSKSTSDSFGRARHSRSVSTQGHSAIGMRRDSTPRRLTPTSSNTSPQYHLTGLPPITPRQSSFMGRRESVESNLSKSVQRRLSMTSPSMNSASPSERANLRHIGEGALDSSDSESSGDEADEGNNIGYSSEEDSNLVSSAGAPSLLQTSSSRVLVSAQPSPLSRTYWGGDDDELDRHDEDGEPSSDSPSPQSTDTENSDNSRSEAVSPSFRRPSKFRSKTRSRSSTLASLPAPSGIQPRPLKPQNSHNSIRTVTVGDVSLPHEAFDREEVVRDISNRFAARQRIDVIPDISVDDGRTVDAAHSFHPTTTTNRNQEAVRADEAMYLDSGWQALKEALEEFAEEGDVQMCAMMCAVASKELKIGKRRTLQFLDSYIEQISRLKLDITAAYLRKHAEIEQIAQATTLGTTIYTSCGKCRKALTIPITVQKPGGQKQGFHYCTTCKANCIKCAICRLPVRKLLFQCSVCGHGGHQDCYRRYYMNRPMAELPGMTTSTVKNQEQTAPSIVIDRHLTTSLHEDNDEDEDPHEVSTAKSDTSTGSALPVQPKNKFWGHPCAAGCGHFCWAANGG